MFVEHQSTSDTKIYTVVSSSKRDIADFCHY